MLYYIQTGKLIGKTFEEKSIQFNRRNFDGG